MPPKAKLSGGARASIDTAQIPNVSGMPVPVQVGEKVFYIHEGTLTSTSKFFVNAMKPEWRTDPQKPIDLSDDEPERFEVYCQWLYGRKIAEKEAVSATEFHLAKLYVFGEKIMDETFQNAVLTTFMDICHAEQLYPGNDVVRMIYKGTSGPELPARRLLVDIWTYGDHDFHIHASVLSATSPFFKNALKPQPPYRSLRREHHYSQDLLPKAIRPQTRIHGRADLQRPDAPLRLRSVPVGPDVRECSPGRYHRLRHELHRRHGSLRLPFSE
jgi:hypothetical protein